MLERKHTACYEHKSHANDDSREAQIISICSFRGSESDSEMLNFFFIFFFNFDNLFQESYTFKWEKLNWIFFYSNVLMRILICWKYFIYCIRTYYFAMRNRLLWNAAILLVVILWMNWPLMGPLYFAWCTDTNATVWWLFSFKRIHLFILTPSIGTHHNDSCQQKRKINRCSKR